MSTKTFNEILGIQPKPKGMETVQETSPVAPTTLPAGGQRVESQAPKQAPTIDSTLQGLPGAQQDKVPTGSVRPTTNLNQSEAEVGKVRQQDGGQDRIADPTATRQAVNDQDDADRQAKVTGMVKDMSAGLTHNSLVEQRKNELPLTKDGKIDWSQLRDENGNIDWNKISNLSEQAQMEYLKRVADDTPDETPEQRKKREKREKWSKIFSAIGDGVSAMANLYYASKGAPDMSAGARGSLSKASQALYDRLKAEREQNRQQRMNALHNIGALANTHVANEQKKEIQKMQVMRQAQDLELKAKEYELKAEDYKRKGRLNDANIALAQARQAESEARKLKIEIENKYLPQKMEDAHAVAVSTVHRNEGSAANSRAHANKATQTPARGSGSGRGRGSGGGKYTFRGKNYPNATMYNKAVMDYARKNGIQLKVQEEGSVGIPSWRTKSVAELAAEGEAYTEQGGNNGSSGGRHRNFASMGNFYVKK